MRAFESPLGSRRRLPWLPAALLFVLLVAAVYSDVLFARRNFGGRDLGGYHLPIEKSVHDAYARGRLPVWIDAISGGRPLAPNPNVGGFYPVRPALARVPFPMAMRLYPILHWIAGGIGIMLLARAIGSSPAAAWMSAVTFTFSGVSVTEVFYTNIHPGLVLLPWTLWLFLRAGSGPITRVLPLGVVFGLLLLAGDVISSGLGLLLCLLWTLSETEPSRRRRSFAIASLAFVLGVLLALPQIVATALWIPHTTRAVLGMKVSEALAYSVPPWRLLELAVPYPFGPVGSLDFDRAWYLFQNRAVGFFATFYCGAFALVAAVAAWRSRAVGGRFSRVLLLLAPLFVMPTSLIYEYFPNAGMPVPLRYPEKLAVIAVLALSLQVAIAWDGFRRGELRLGRWSVAMAAVLAAVALFARARPESAGSAALALFGGVALHGEEGVGREIAISFAEGGIWWALTFLALAALRARLAAVALLVLTLVPIAANRRIAVSFPEEEVLAARPFARFQMREDPSGAFRAVSEWLYGGPSKLEAAARFSDPGGIAASFQNWDLYAGALWNRGTVFNRDFDHGDLSRQDTLRKISMFAGKFRDSTSFWPPYSLRWGVRWADQDEVPGFQVVRRLGRQIWDENPGALPDVRIATRWREVPDGMAAGGILASLASDEIVLETGRPGAGAALPGRLRVLEKMPERLRIETEAAQASWLFVLRGFWPYRDVRLDGEPVEVVPAQVAFSAIPVPPGRHRIDWEEKMPGWPLAWAGPVLFLAGALWIVRRGRGSPEAELP